MKLHRIMLLITAGLLFSATIAAPVLPYVFFIFLRIVVCGVAVYSAFRALDTLLLFIGLLMIAVLFNPFIVVHLPQPTWRVVDLVAASTFIRLAIKLPEVLTK